MRFLDRYKRLTFWNKLGVWGALASILGLMIVLFSFNNNENGPPPPTPSPEFTIGYLAARAQWAATGGIYVLCTKESPTTCEVLIKFLQKKMQPFDTGPFLSEIEQYASSVGWPSESFLYNFRRIVSPASLVRSLNRIKTDGDSARRELELKRLCDEIDEITHLLFQEGRQHGLSMADLGLVFLGNQIGKTEQLISIGSIAKQEDKIIGSCRTWIGIIARAQLHPEYKLEERLRHIWEEYPNVYARFESLSLAEMSVLIGRIKSQFLDVTDPTIR